MKKYIKSSDSQTSHELYHLYPDITDNHKADYYAMISESGDGTATLFSWGSPICIMRLSDKKIIYKEPNLDSNEKKWLSDFKKLVSQKEQYIGLTHCLYFNGDMIEYSTDATSMFNKLYQMLEDAESNGDPVDISSCYLTRVPTVMDKNGSPVEYIWEDEHKYFGLTKPGTTIKDVLTVMDRAKGNYI